MLRSTAEKLYALDADWAGPVQVEPGSPDPRRTPTARDHLRSLVALGWSMTELGRRLGMAHPPNVNPVFHGRVMQARTVDAVEELFGQLCMTRPPEHTKGQRTVATRARKYAATRGWLPPLALDDLGSSGGVGVDLEPDVEDAALDIDEVAIQRRINGDKTVRLSRAESLQLARR